MTVRVRNWLPLVLVVLLAGCGSCQKTEEAPKPGAAPAAKPAAPGAPPAAQQPAAQQPAAQAGPTQPEVDCFVLVDADPDFGGPPLKVQFDTEIDCTGSPVTYSWDFGDGTTGGNEPAPVHTYDKPGDYVAVVKVKAPDGGEGEDEIDITIDADFEE